MKTNKANQIVTLLMGMLMVAVTVTGLSAYGVPSPQGALSGAAHQADGKPVGETVDFAGYRCMLPGAQWKQYASPEDAGFCSDKLATAKTFFEQCSGDSMMVVYRGVVLAAWGDYQRRYRCPALKEQFISALHGIYAEKGIMDAAKTTDAKTSFNTLCGTFEQETGLDALHSFNRRFADPLQMEDFRLSDAAIDYTVLPSGHEDDPFRMSARDLARFGLLYMLNGQWKGNQLVPTKCATLPKSSARGVDGQRLHIVPEADLVFVHLTNAANQNKVTDKQVDRLLTMVLEARTSQPKSSPFLVTLANHSPAMQSVALAVKTKTPAADK